MSEEASPIFEDVEQKRFEEKAAAIVREELKKNNERDQSDNLSNKVERIRERMERQNKENDNQPVAKKIDKPELSIDESCPSCHKHKLDIHGNTASCQGEDCNSSFLLVEKHKDKIPERKDFLCVDCGHSLTKGEALGLKDNDGICPLCGKEQTSLVDIDWNNIDKNLKKFNKDRKR